MEEKQIEKKEVKEKETGFYIGEQPTDFQKVIVKDGEVVNPLELLAEIANIIQRNGLK